MNNNKYVGAFAVPKFTKSVLHFPVVRQQCPTTFGVFLRAVVC